MVQRLTRSTLVILIAGLAALALSGTAEAQYKYFEPGAGTPATPGAFYGPGTGFSNEGEIVKLVRKRRMPVVGDGAGVWSFIHIDDAASAAVAAIDHGAPGVYNIVDDEPAPVRVWLPELARVVGAKPPRHVPVWSGSAGSPPAKSACR